MIKVILLRAPCQNVNVLLLKNKNVDKIKNVKKRKNVEGRKQKKRFFTSMT